MFTETKSRLGWRTGASRFTMKEQLESLQSFDPPERAQAGQQLVELGLSRSAELLLDHVANEFDNRVLAAIAAAVVQAPPEATESRTAQELREGAAEELERSALEEAFMGGEPEPVAFAPAPDFQFPPEPDFEAVGLEAAPQPLPVRVPVAAGAAVEPTGEPAPIEYRFEVPEPEVAPIEYRPADPIEHRPLEQPVEQPAPEPIEYRFDAPAPVAEYEVEPPAPVDEYQVEPPAPVAEYEPDAEVPQYISWRPPAEDDISTEPSTNGHDAWMEPTPALEAEVVEAEEIEADPEPEPAASEYGFETSEPVEYQYESPATAELPADVPEDSCQEYRFEAPDAPGTPEPAGDAEVFRFEGPLPSERPAEPTNGEPRTLAERLKARDS
ncbi:MAG: hypothetical protein ACT4PI_06010 [Actinomycetota bacterium]